MTVNLSEALRAFVEQKVSSGQYASADEVIETALLELKNAETGELDARWLRAKLAVGESDLDEGKFLPADQAIADIKDRAQRLLARNKAAS